MKNDNKPTIICTSQNGNKVEVETDKIITRISAYGILIDNDKALVIQAHLPIWEFPGGGNSPDETLHGTLIREFKEETGLIVKPSQLILEKESFYISPSRKTYHSFQHFFKVKKIGGRMFKSSVNLTGAKWFPIKKLSNDNMNAGAFVALTALFNNSTKYQFLP